MKKLLLLSALLSTHCFLRPITPTPACQKQMDHCLKMCPVNTAEQLRQPFFDQRSDCERRCQDICLKAEKEGKVDDKK